jgi:DNA adenine methylase
MIRPFLKWAGGKQRQVHALMDAVQSLPPPEHTWVYYEPFLGGGSLYFALRPSYAVLSDINERLMRTYRAVRRSPEDVIAMLRAMPQQDRELFHALRAAPAQDTDVQEAARMIYVVRTCFGGIYRESASGQCTSSYGGLRWSGGDDGIRECSKALRGARLEVRDALGAIAQAQSGDLLYCDPPYLSATASVRYAARGFGEIDHVRLRDALLSAAHRGVRVIASNSAEALELYTDPVWRVSELGVTRVCGGTGLRTRELLITSVKQGA